MKNYKNIFKNEFIKVPFFKPDISYSDKQIISKTLSSSLLTNGPKLKKFENDFSTFTKSKFSVGVSSATAALHLSLRALGLKKDDEVLVPDITFVATANAILMNGSKPILVDVNENDLNINLESIEKNINKKTKAIIPVHMAGYSCDMKNILEISNKFGLYVIEDCAHAIGTYFKNKHVGSFGDFGCFSFYPTKNLTTLEGGMVCTNSSTLSENVSILRNHGITRNLIERYTEGFPWEYDVKDYGYNYRMDEIRASLGINQLKRLKKNNTKRKNAFKYYNKFLSKIEGIEIPPVKNLENSSCHLYIIKIDEKRFGLDRNSVFKKLLSKGIQTSVHYKPLHTFSLFRNSMKSKNSLRNSITLENKILSLPMFSNISKIQQDFVINALSKMKN